jgi:hypothetical protein
MKNFWNGKQIEMKKCSGCGVYSANYVIKNGKCKDCQSVPKQEITEQKATDENQATDCKKE